MSKGKTAHPKKRWSDTRHNGAQIKTAYTNDYNNILHLNTGLALLIAIIVNCMSWFQLRTAAISNGTVSVSL